MKVTKINGIFLILAIALLSLIALSCTGQVAEDTMGKSATLKAKNSADTEAGKEREGIKRSAGAVIYGRPEKIKVYRCSEPTVVKPGSPDYEKLLDAGERVMLRVSSSAGEPPVNKENFSRMIGESPAAIQFIYQKEPVFTYLETPERIKSDKILSSVQNLATITFFIPTDAGLIEPGTVYDGFYSGNVHMVSTLTNAELIDVVKEMN